MQLLKIIQICSPTRILTPIPIRVFLPHTKLPSPPSTATAPPSSASPESVGAAMGGARLQRGRLRSVTARRGGGALPRLRPLYGHLENPPDGRFRKRMDKDRRGENGMSRKEGAACWRPPWYYPAPVLDSLPKESDLNHVFK